MQTLSEIKVDVDRLAGIIGAPENILPTYGWCEGSARPHIELDDRGYHYVVSERGQELQRITTWNLDTLLGHIFDSVSFGMAAKYELHHRIQGQDSRRLLWKRQLELLRILSPEWAALRSSEIDDILQKHPYNDN